MKHIGLPKRCRKHMQTVGLLGTPGAPRREAAGPVSAPTHARRTWTL